MTVQSESAVARSAESVATVSTTNGRSRPLPLPPVSGLSNRIAQRGSKGKSKQIPLLPLRPPSTRSLDSRLAPQSDDSHRRVMATPKGESQIPTPVEMNASASHKPPNRRDDNAKAGPSNLSKQQARPRRNRALSPIPKRKRPLIQSRSNSTISSATSQCQSYQSFPVAPSNEIDIFTMNNSRLERRSLSPTLRRQYRPHPRPAPFRTIQPGKSSFVQSLPRTVQSQRLTSPNALSTVTTNRTISHIRTVLPLNSAVAKLATVYLNQLAKLRVSAFPLTADKATLYLVYMLPAGVVVADQIRKRAGELKTKKNTQPKDVAKTLEMLREIKALSDPFWSIGTARGMEKNELDTEKCRPLWDLVMGFGELIPPVVDTVFVTRSSLQLTSRLLSADNCCTEHKKRPHSTRLDAQAKRYKSTSLIPPHPLDAPFGRSIPHVAARPYLIHDVKSEPDVDEALSFIDPAEARPLKRPHPLSREPGPSLVDSVPLARERLANSFPKINVVAEETLSLPKMEDEREEDDEQYGAQSFELEESGLEEQVPRSVRNGQMLAVVEEVTEPPSQAVSMMVAVNSSQLQRLEAGYSQSLVEQTTQENGDPDSASYPALASSFVVPETVPPASFRQIHFLPGTPHFSSPPPLLSSAPLRAVSAPLHSSPHSFAVHPHVSSLPLALDDLPLPPDDFSQPFDAHSRIPTPPPASTVVRSTRIVAQYRSKARERADAMRLKDLLELLDESDTAEEEGISAAVATNLRRTVDEERVIDVGAKSLWKPIGSKSQEKRLEKRLAALRKEDRRLRADIHWRGLAAVEAMDFEREMMHFPWERMLFSRSEQSFYLDDPSLASPTSSLLHRPHSGRNSISTPPFLEAKSLLLAPKARPTPPPATGLDEERRVSDVACEVIVVSSDSEE